MPGFLFYTASRFGFLGTVTFGLVQFLVITLYPALAEATQLGLGQIILCFTLSSFLFIWSSPFWAKKSDFIGRPWAMTFGLGGLSFSFFILIILTTIRLHPTWGVALLLFSRIIYGLTASAIVSVAQVWWRDQKGDVTKLMITHSLGLNVGRFLAPVFVFAFDGELRFILWIVFVWCLVLTISGLCSDREDLKILTRRDRYRNSLVLSVPLGLAFAATSFVGLIHSLLSPHIQACLNLASSATTLVCAQALILSNIIVIAIQFILRRLPKVKGIPLLWTGICSWIMASILFIDVRTLDQLWLSLFFISIGLATITPGYLSLLKGGSRSAGQMGSVQTLGLTLGGALAYASVQGHVSLGCCLVLLCLVLISFMMPLQMKNFREAIP